MLLKGIHQFKAQHAFLLQHPDWVKKLEFKSIPDRTTLSRRYKQLATRIEQFVDYFGDLGITLDTDTPRDVVFVDKSLSIKQKAVCGIKKTEKKITFPKVYATLIQMQVGQQASIVDGFMAMDCISQLQQTDFRCLQMFIPLL